MPPTDATTVADLQPARLLFLGGRSRVGVRHVAERLAETMAELLIAEAEPPTAAECIEGGLAPCRDAGVVVEGKEATANTPTLPFAEGRGVEAERHGPDSGAH